MKSKSIGRTYRHLNRYRQILAILFKYGFDDVVDTLKIDQYVEAALQMITKSGGRVGKLTRVERIRMVLEELGPTFTKLGQVLSTRPDLAPIELLNELAKLQDDVPARSFEEVRLTLETELGAPPEEFFEVLEKKPLATASIGQVHKAVLKSGEEVAVKVQRAGIGRAIEVDLEIMLHLATLMERHVEGMDLYNPVRMVEEFARVIERETDYKIEASNMERFARRFATDSTIHVPAVFRDLTTERVLTMEFVKGIKVTDIENLETAGLNRKTIVSRGASYLLKQIFDHGFFHADPHPGNIFVLPENVVCLLDFGMVGSVDRTTREDFVDLIFGVVRRDESKICRILIKIAGFDSEPDTRALERDIADFIDLHLFKPLKDIEASKVMQDLLDLAGRHRVRIPPDIFLMMKSLGTVEGIARIVDPDFDMIGAAAPFIERIRIARLHPQRVADDTVSLLSELIRFMHQFPRNSLEIVEMLRRRKLIVKIDHAGMNNLLNTTDRTANKISFSIIIAALIVGSALIVISKTPPLFFGISLIGIILFFAAAIMGIWLLVAILRKGGL